MTHYLLHAWNSYDQNFSSKEFRGIYELKKVCITQNKKKCKDLAVLAKTPRSLLL